MNNSNAIAADLAWLEAAMAARFAAYGGPDTPSELPAPPEIAGSGGYSAIVGAHALDIAGRLMLILALAPQIAPAILDPFLLRNQATDRRFTEFGGVAGESHAGFLPTAQTACFLLAGTDVAEAVAFAAALPGHRLVRSRKLLLDRPHPREPLLAARLRLADRVLAGILNA